MQTSVQVEAATNMHTGTIYLLILLSILHLILLNADTYYSINNISTRVQHVLKAKIALSLISSSPIIIVSTCPIALSLVNFNYTQINKKLITMFLIYICVTNNLPTLFRELYNKNDNNLI
jgi:hypothetical protein